MSKIKLFKETGEIEFNVPNKVIEGQYITCVENGLWYRFNIDDYEVLDDGTCNVYSHTLIAVDGKRVH